MKAIGFYLSGPVPPELEELEKNVGKLSPQAIALLNEYTANVVSLILLGDCLLDKKESDPETLYFLAGRDIVRPALVKLMEMDPILRPILLMKWKYFTATAWVEFQGWARELLLESLRTSSTHVALVAK